MKSAMRKRVYYSVAVISMCLQCWSMTSARTQRPTPTPDSRYLEAQKAFDEAVVLFKQGTLDSLSVSIIKFETSRKLFHETGSRVYAAPSLLMLGMVHYRLGNIQQALTYLDQALELVRNEGYKSQALIGPNAIGIRMVYFLEAMVLNGIGAVYSDLGNRQKALSVLNEAFRLLRRIGDDQDGEVTTLLNIGAAYYHLGDQQKALSSLNEALRLLRGILRGIEDKNREAATLNNIGLVYSALGDQQKALDSFNEALLLLRGVRDKSKDAKVLNNIGLVYSALGDQQKALDSFNEALLLLKTFQDKRAEVATLTDLMVFWQMQKNPRLATYYGKQAINIHQQLRSSIRELEKEIQKTYLQTIADTYRVLADLLIAQGRIPEAEQVLGMLKEEELFEYVRRSGDVADQLRERADLNELERKALNEYSKYGDSLTEIGSRLEGLDRERLKFPADNFPQQAEYDRLKLQLEDAKRVFIVFLRELADKFGKSNEKVKQIESALQADLKRWGANNVVIISSIVHEERLNLIVTTSSTPPIAHIIDIKVVDLNNLVQEFRAVVNDRSTKYDPRPLGQRLYDVLLKPLEKDLAGAKADTLLWSLDGALRYVPVTALWDGKQYLVERYNNVIITLASRSKIGEALEDSKTNWQALAAGVSTKWPGFDELAAVPEELRSIVRGIGIQNPAEEKGVLSGQRLLNDQFTLTSFEHALGRYPLIHIASHFRFRPGNETESFLLLGDGSHLTMDKVSLASSMFHGVELLALSACDTATSGTDANGAEVESFGVIAQEQGAKAVLGTLWRVADVSTRDLMVAFYSTYSTNPDINKAEALRRAQLSLLRGTQEVGTKSADARADVGTPVNSAQPLFQKDPARPFSHPYYWAPFVLIGNWR